MNITRRTGLAAASVLALIASPLAGQEPWTEAPAPGTVALTREEAVERARAASPALEAARANARAADAGADAAGSFVWPSVAVEAGAVRSDDPVAVFGGRLRHGTFGEADFAVDRLVDPDALTDWALGAGARWQALDATRWAAGDAARERAEAARLGAERAADAAAYTARVLWIEAAGAEDALDAALAAEEAAGATATVLRRRRDEGMLTDADALRGEAALAAARAARIRAEQRRVDARLRLGAHLGYPPGTEVQPAGALEAPRSAGALVGPPPEGVPDRADLAAAARGVDAARAAERAAGAARLPAADVFAGVTRHAPGAFDDGRTLWTAGVQVRVPVFTGFALSSEERRARALREAAEAELERLRLDAAAEARQASRGVLAAEAALDASAAAATAAGEALRLTRRRFEEGMATTADLLQAQASSAAADADAVEALATLNRALATLAFVNPEIRLPEEGRLP